MGERIESVHVHCIDARGMIEEYREKGFVLKERLPPTIPAQPGFIKLVFELPEGAEVKAGKKAYLG